jgi:hypothetical protein
LQELNLILIGQIIIYLCSQIVLQPAIIQRVYSFAPYYIESGCYSKVRSHLVIPSAGQLAIEVITLIPRHFIFLLLVD